MPVRHAIADFGSVKSPVILLVEDEPVIAEHIRSVFRDFNCQVVAAIDGEEALLLCTEYLPDFAVLNFYQKEAVDGLVLARSLRLVCPIKVFFITGARQEDLAASPAFNVCEFFLFKPFTRRQLRSALENFFPENSK